MNDRLWRIIFVDPSSPRLVDRTETRTLAVTDPVTGHVYLSNALYGEMLVKVLLHELGHCAMVSFNLLDDIHRMVKREYWIEAEEWICNFLADYGKKIFEIAYSTLGSDAWRVVPYELDRFVS